MEAGRQCTLLLPLELSLHRWLLGAITSVAAPQLMRGMEGRYISNIRQKGLGKSIQAIRG